MYGERFRGTRFRHYRVRRSNSSRAQHANGSKNRILAIEGLESRQLLTRLVDIDLDGDIDFATATAWHENIDGQGRFHRHALTSSIGAPADSGDVHFDIADVNGDGRVDIVLATGQWLENQVAHDRKSDGFVSREFSRSTATHVTARDVDRDGDIDLVALAADSISVFVNSDGRGQFEHAGASAWKAPSSNVDSSVIVDDLNGDGRYDLLTVEQLTTEACQPACHVVTYHASESTPSGNRFDAQSLLLLPDDEPKVQIHLTDIDDDAREDLVVELNDRWFWVRNSDGEFTSTRSGGQLDGDLIAFRDIDRDERIDLVFSKGEQIAWRPVGSHTLSGETGDLSSVGLSSNEVSDIGDINSDGTLDLVTTRQFDRQPVWLDGALMRLSPGPSTTHLAGDSNFDGIFDSTDLIAVFQVGEYEDRIPNNSTFAEGDWNGDGDFNSNDIVHAFVLGNYELAQYPRLAFTASDIPDIKQAIAANRKMADRFTRELTYAVGKLETDYSDPSLLENRKSRDASRIAFVVLMLENDHPQRSDLAAKAREILRHANDGVWSSTNVLPTHHAGFEGIDLHPWHTGSSLMEYSLAYDWLLGAGEMDPSTRAEAKFRILRMAQLEHDVHSTPQAELDRDLFYLRNANKRFRSVSGVGIVALAFPDHTGEIFDPQNRLPEELRTPFNSHEVLSWVLHEMFEQITIALPSDPTDQGMIPHYVSSDGIYGESFTYQLDAFEVTTPFLVFLERTTGMDYLTADGIFDDRISRMYDNNLKVMLPDHTRPPIGDAWEGKRYDYHELIAPYTENPSEHFWAYEEAFNIQTKNFGLSASGLRFKDAPMEEPEYRTEFFEDAGLAVMRDQWGEDATYLMMVATDRPIRGHRQADQGSFMLYAGGTHLVLDPGYGTAYGRDPDARGYIEGGRWNWINSAMGHSGITIDSLYTLDTTPADELRTVVHPRSTTQSYSKVPDPARIRNTLASPDIDYAEAQVVYTEKEAQLDRAIAFPRHRYFLIEDRIEAATQHDYGWQLQLGETETGDFTSVGDERHVWTIPNDDGELIALSIEMLSGDRTTNVYENGPTNKDGLVYPEDIYDHTYLISSQQAEDSRFVTLLDPYRAEAETPVQVQSLEEDRVWKVTHSATEYDLILSQPTSRFQSIGEINTDAEFLVASIDVIDGVERVSSLLVRNASTVFVGYTTRELFSVEPQQVIKLI